MATQKHIPSYLKTLMTLSAPLESAASRSQATFDRAAIMRAAWKEWRAAQRRGWHLLEGPDTWTWARCIRFAQAQARARRGGFAAVEDAIKAVLAEADQQTFC